jgi:hypothetical protein
MSVRIGTSGFASTQQKVRLVPMADANRGKTIKLTFCLVLMSIMFLDVLPRSVPGLQGIKSVLNAGLNRVGLWQGPWTMFTPDPVIGNGWFSDELTLSDGSVLKWDSPYWADKGTWEKFVRFRYVNYYNRLYLPANAAGIGDLQDYLARTLVPADGPQVVSSMMSRTRMQLLLPEDGTLPTLDENEWVFTAEPYGRRNYEP